MSGLTMGLLSLDMMTLKVLKDGGTTAEKKHSQKILPIIQRHHLLLVTLLLGNAAAVEAMGWRIDLLDHLVLHQVSRVHTEAVIELMGLEPHRVHKIYPELGNIGPAGVPIALAHAVQLGKISDGDRVALLGIGSGLNCAMAEIHW